MPHPNDPNFPNFPNISWSRPDDSTVRYSSTICLSDGREYDYTILVDVKWAAFGPATCLNAVELLKPVTKEPPMEEHDPLYKETIDKLKKEVIDNHNDICYTT